MIVPLRIAMMSTDKTRMQMTVTENPFEIFKREWDAREGVKMLRQEELKKKFLYNLAVSQIREGNGKGVDMYCELAVGNWLKANSEPEFSQEELTVAIKSGVDVVMENRRITAVKNVEVAIAARETARKAMVNAGSAFLSCNSQEYDALALASRMGGESFERKRDEEEAARKNLKKAERLANEIKKQN